MPKIFSNLFAIKNVVFGKFRDGAKILERMELVIVRFFLPFIGIDDKIVTRKGSPFSGGRRLSQQYYPQPLVLRKLLSFLTFNVAFASFLFLFTSSLSLKSLSMFSFDLFSFKISWLKSSS